MNAEQQLGTTVLLPVYLGEPSAENLCFLRRAVESVRDQRFPGPYEILIVDDGSPEPVAAACGEIGSHALLQGVRILRSERNEGLVHALNLGLAKSAFPFIARIDADDRWLPGKIERQFEQFLTDPDLTISATGMRSVGPAGEERAIHIRPGGWAAILDFFVEEGCPFPHGSVFARRAVYRLLGGYSHDPRTAHCEDYALWAVWLRFFKPAIVEAALYDYTVHDQSVSMRHARQQQLGSTLVREGFCAVGSARRVPQALLSLSLALGSTLIEAGMLAYRMWRYRMTARLPCAAVPPLALLMPDRRLDEVDDQHAAGFDRILGRSTAQAGDRQTAVRVS